MGDQTFHTPNFGDEEFDIPPITLPNDGSHPQTNIPYNTMMGHDRQQQHYAQMYLPEHMTTHSGVTYGGSPPTYTTLSSPHSQQPMGNHHMVHHQQQGQRSLGRSPNNPSPPRNPEHTSEDSDDSVPHTQAQMSGVVAKRPSPEPVAAVVGKKPKPQKKKKKRDPNEPQKPVSAYALFFRDTQAAIKGQNPNASFGEVSKIVASMWDGLEVDHKNVYKKKTEAAKKEYLKALAAYRASLVSKGAPTDSPDGSGMYPPGFQQSPPPPQQHYAQQNFYAGQQKKSQASQQVIPQNQASQQHSPQQQSPQQQMLQHHNHVLDNQYSRQQQQHQGQGYIQQMGDGMGMHPPQHQQLMSHDTQVHGRGGQMCVRNGCGNGSVTSHEWDDEYCSSDCVVTHCRDVFTNWVSTNQGGNGTYHTGAVKFSGSGGVVGPDGLSYAT